MTTPITDKAQQDALTLILALATVSTDDYVMMGPMGLMGRLRQIATAVEAEQKRQRDARVIDALKRNHDNRKGKRRGRRG